MVEPYNNCLQFTTYIGRCVIAFWCVFTCDVVYFWSIMAKPRSIAFLRELKKNKNNVQKTALEAGYSPNYARARGKRIVETAMKDVAKDVAKQVEAKELTPLQGKKKMAEIVGVSEQDLMKRLHWLALEQDKDLGTALKVLAPLSKEYGVILNADDDQKSITVPILNIVVDKTPPQIEGEVKNG